MKGFSYLLTPTLIVWLRRSILFGISYPCALRAHHFVMLKIVYPDDFVRGILTIFQKKKRSIHGLGLSCTWYGMSSFLLKNRQNSAKSERRPIGASSYGFSLLEVLIALTIVSSAFLYLLAQQLKITQSIQTTYFYNLAAQQIFSFSQRLAVNRDVVFQRQELYLWEKENAQVLPQSHGSYQHTNGIYNIKMTWFFLNHVSICGRYHD